MVKSACGTNKGRIRTVNEDSMLCMETLNFFMLADGVGGHNSGDVASGLAVELTEKYLLANPPDNVAESELPAFFSHCLRMVNEEIYQKAVSNEENAGMATTAIMLLLRSDKAFIVNIGDSRAYVLRRGKLLKITEDHTYVNELIKNGRINKEEAECHPKKHMITRALGSEKNIQPDFYFIDIYHGDRVLLCTDGLYNEVDESDICRLMNEIEDVTELVEALIGLACDNGGRDNITVNCVEIQNR